MDVNSLESKNRGLRDILAQIGIKTTNVSTGKVKTQEIREVDHFSSTMRVGLAQQTQQQLDNSRVVLKQERSHLQAPSDVTGALHVSTLKNTTYRDRVDEHASQFGKKVIDESKIVERVSTY